MKYFYAFSHAGNGVPIDLYRFRDAAERTRWIMGGWGRLPWTKRSVPAGLVWVDPDIYHAPEDEQEAAKVACESASLVGN